MHKKLFLLFLLTGISVGAYTFINLDAYSINYGDTYYVIPADSMALLIFAYFILAAIICFALRNYFNFHLGILTYFILTIPIIYMCWYNGIGEAVSLFNNTIWTSEYITNGMIILFLTGNILFFINIFISIFKLLKKNNSAIT